jgi:PAS domain S-box-containing protein
MCGWDWNMVTGEDSFYGDTAGIFSTAPGDSYANLRRLIHPEDLERVEKELADAIENHCDYDGEFRVVHPDGRVHWIRGRGKFFYEDGKAVRMVGVNVDVTEHRNRERELAEAKADLQAQKTLLENIVDNIPILLCYMREPGKVHWVNRTWEDTLGWTPADNGGDLAPLLYPDPRQAAKVREFIGKASGGWGEFSLRTKAGGTIDAEFMNLMLPDGVHIGIGRDLTVQKRSIQELIASGRRFRMLSENIPQMVWISDPDGRTQYYNQRWYQFTGQTPAQARGYGWRLMVHPDDVEANQQAWAEAIERKSNFEDELRLRRHDGEYRWFLVRAIPIRDLQGRLERWFGTSTDITERREHEEQLRRSEARYRTLVEATAQMVWTANGAGDAFGSLEGWNEFTGQTPEDAGSGGWFAAIHPDDALASQEAWRHAVETHTVFRHEHRVRRRDGAYRLMSSRAVPIIDDGGNIMEWIGTHTDITDQKLAEQALIRAEKLATAGRLAATVAHEVNNPLTAVTNIHYILGTDESLPENVRAYLSLAESELQRVSHVLRQTLAFYREHARIQQIKLAPLVEEVISIFAYRLRSRGIMLETRIREGTMLSAMPGELRQILCNLLANSFDASARGGRIAIRAHTVRGDGGGEAVRIAVADNGGGITHENQAHLFEAFFTTKESLGTGLSLWVVRQLAERNAGRICVRSRAGVGTVFVLEFPVEASVSAVGLNSAEGTNQLASGNGAAGSDGDGAEGAEGAIPLNEAAHAGDLTVPVQ